jgi:hypothetical protein
MQLNLKKALILWIWISNFSKRRDRADNKLTVAPILIWSRIREPKNLIPGNTRNEDDLFILMKF